MNKIYQNQICPHKHAKFAVTNLHANFSAEYHVIHAKISFRRGTRKNYFGECDRNCEIIISNRTSCKLYRYKKCISIGMNPSSVMTSDEINKVLQRSCF